MAKRRTKKRTHVPIDQEALKGIPKSMVIRVGQTSLSNHSLNQLVKDFRQIMQPYTAIKLKERKSNKLKDFVVMCGPLDVSHLFIFTQSEKTGNVSLKVARTPKGPTITFNVLNYSLSKDIKKFLKRPKSLNKEDVLNPPLLVLNGFNTKNNNDKESEDNNVEKIIISIRVLMLHKDSVTKEISLRHYFIDVKDVELSRNLKKLYNAKTHLNKSLPNLHRKKDISSLILDHDINAYTSESEMEDDEDAIVKISENNQNNKIGVIKQSKKPKLDVETGLENEDDEGEGKREVSTNTNNIPYMAPRKKAIRLTEVGPRLNLRLVKIEEGICSGKVLHHEFVHKTDEEIRLLERRHQAKLRLKEQRKKEQEANIAKKKAAKEAKKQRKLERRNARKELEDQDKLNEDQNTSEESDSEIDSEDHFSDVPDDIDSDLFSEVEDAM
ncbi:rRNA-binding ribosome biosynthesis protein PWA37_004366 [Arxiozyma heterogenica]|uniref:rRNA-binding ribosome biosynthesis protein n=1 Tax=Arxiozyma heterogenica TaxID=278026 RepID=UPI002F086B30